MFEELLSYRLPVFDTDTRDTIAALLISDGLQLAQPLKIGPVLTHHMALLQKANPKVHSAVIKKAVRDNFLRICEAVSDEYEHPVADFRRCWMDVHNAGIKPGMEAARSPEEASIMDPAEIAKRLRTSLQYAMSPLDGPMTVAHECKVAIRLITCGLTGARDAFPGPLAMKMTGLADIFPDNIERDRLCEGEYHVFGAVNPDMRHVRGFIIDKMVRLQRNWPTPARVLAGMRP